MDAMKIVKRNFHVDDSQTNHRYNMILDCDILYELKTDLFISYYTIRRNEGASKGFVNPMKDAEHLTLENSLIVLMTKSFGVKNHGKVKM